MAKSEYPDGPRINAPLALLKQMLPAVFPFDTLAFTLNVSRQYGDVAYYRFGPLDVYHLCHPDLAQQILVEQQEKFRKPELLRHAFGPFAGEGLLTSEGAVWKRQRKLMQPAFHHRQLAAYGNVMVTQTLGVMDSFAEEQVREMASEMAELTLNIVAKCLFGAELPSELKQIRAAMVAMIAAANRRVNSILRMPSWVPTAGNIQERRALAKMDGVLQVLFESRRQSPKQRDDLLSVLLAATGEASGGMSDKQLRDEMLTLFLAGHETTANALTWTWFLLSRHPEVEAKLWDELDRVLQGRAPEPADLAKLPYTEMVIRESLRLYPPAPAVAREPVEDTTIAGYRIRKGSLLSINTYALQRDARFYPDPERYDPERFSPGWEERIPRYTYLPFGAGPRVCIGNAFAMMEARLILATVAQRYKLSLEPDQKVVPVQVITVKPRGPVWMRLERRGDATKVSGAG
ncbi:MAG TPA: cytochrome P450 [Bryobacteraceae bacterium]|nr:cytochrome P450 [Bryobacteraceae bacterium]